MWVIFKTFNEFITILLLFLCFWFFGPSGIWDPSSQPGIEPALEGEVLTNGPSGKFPGFIFESEKAIKMDFPSYSGLTTLSYMKTSDLLCHKNVMTNHCLYRQRNASNSIVTKLWVLLSDRFAFECYYCYLVSYGLRQIAFFKQIKVKIIIHIHIVIKRVFNKI